MTVMAEPWRAAATAWRGRARRSAGLLLGGSAVVLLAVSILSLAIGPTGISLNSLPRVLWSLLQDNPGGDTVRERMVLLDLRLPRLLLGMLVGAGLALSGALMQGLFRNPLADPALIGVSSGAVLGAVLVIAFGHALAEPWSKAAGSYALPLAAFAGGLAVTRFLVLIASRRGEISVSMLLLAGIATSAIAGSLTGLIAFASDDRELRDMTLWTLGSLTGASWTKLAVVLPLAVLVAALVPGLVRALNGLLLGEAEAYHLGIDVPRVKRRIVLVTAAAVGAAVAVAGLVGFVGIVIPHLVRLIAGPDHRVVLPASALLGAALVVGGDIIARMIVRPAELPIGIVMALLGGPVFLHLVLSRSSNG